MPITWLKSYAARLQEQCTGSRIRCSNEQQHAAGAGPATPKAYFDAHRLARAEPPAWKWTMAIAGRMWNTNRGPRVHLYADANIQGGDANGTPTPAGEEIQKGTVSPLLPAQPDSNGAGKGASLRQPGPIRDDGPCGRRLGAASDAGPSGSDAANSGRWSRQCRQRRRGIGRHAQPVERHVQVRTSVRARGPAAASSPAPAGSWKKAQQSFAGE